MTTSPTWNSSVVGVAVVSPTHRPSMDFARQHTFPLAMASTSHRHLGPHHTASPLRETPGPGAARQTDCRIWLISARRGPDPATLSAAARQTDFLN